VTPSPSKIEKYWPAAATSAALSLLFMAVYGTANAAAAGQPDLGALFFQWERRIPFWSWMIVPYMSIDLFFAAAPFLCRTPRERRVLAGRITLAILTAGAFFFLLPMRYAFPRPVPLDWTAGIYRFLHGFDAPHNLFPSLHIALRTILADFFGRRSSGLWRWASHVWFSLIGFSTLFTHQHHVPDILAGFVLAAVCFYAVPTKEPLRSVVPNRRVGSLYGTGAAMTWAVAVLLPPWGLWFLWPAAALSLMTAAYFGLGAAVFRKTDGGLPLSTRLILGPVLLGQWVSWFFYKRQTRPWDEVVPGLIVGRWLTEREAGQAVEGGVTAVLDLTGEFSEPRAFRQLSYCNVPVLDLTAPTSSQMETAMNFLEKEIKRGRVYVHCKIGYSRSVAVVGGFLLKTGAAPDFPRAVDHLRAKRPSVVIRPEIWRMFPSQERPPCV
jgi:membrane-associated phospholipid phosphatase